MTTLYPSIDLRAGQVVRLRQGDYADQLNYDVDPVATAEAFCAGGAAWLHVVDLDGARTGTRENTAVIANIANAVRGGARVQAGGGVRTLADAAALADAGASRVVMGSAAISDPALVDTVASVLPVAVGLDHRDGVVAVHGWTEASELRLADALGRFPGAAAFVITDISRDGLLAGPDVDGVAAAVAATATPVIASGGVGSLDDVRTLGGIDGLHGVITGRALYESRFSVAQAIVALRGRGTQ